MYVIKAAARNVIPPTGLNAIRRLLGAGREAESARYCYAVWLRHLAKAEVSSAAIEPVSVAELGPGASLGVGIAALLCGAQRYVALDVERQANSNDNVAIFDDLVHLLRSRAPIPGPAEFPELKPDLQSYAFPSQILTASRMERSLQGGRIDELRRLVVDGHLEYVVPWDDAEGIRNASVDLIVSQAVLEHVNDLSGTYNAMQRWLRPGGLMSHQIDFRSHGTSRRWNGHWTYSRPWWQFLRGNRGINRLPVSRHIEAIRDAGLVLLSVECQFRTDGVSRKDLHRDWTWLDDNDLICAGAFIQAIRPAADG